MLNRSELGRHSRSVAATRNSTNQNSIQAESDLLIFLGQQSTEQRGLLMAEPVPFLTVGDLKSELSRWSDDTPVTFRSPLKEQEFRFYRYQAGDKALVLEINEFPETRPEVLPGA